jgi:hypothetical protein
MVRSLRYRACIKFESSWIAARDPWLKGQRYRCCAFQGTIDDPMSNEAIARSFSWSLGGVLGAILLLNAFDGDCDLPA